MEPTQSATEALKKEEDVQPQTTAAPAISRPVEVEDVSDPDEDDLDDLDDMLGDFSEAKLDPTPSKTPAVGPPRPDDGAAPKDPFSMDEDFNEEEFAKQLQEGMAGLLGELESSPEMQRQFEDMFKQMSEAATVEEPKVEGSTPKSGPSSSTPKASKSPADMTPEENLSFQETIRRTMERMQSSGEQATAAAAAGGSDDLMAEFMKQMTSGDFSGDGNEEDFSKMLMNMMEQLTNKEILYEPMKELHDKFPEWLAKNKDSTSAEDLKRYQEQQKIVAEIVSKFDEPTYSDSNAADREFIVDRMQKMQAAGSPPTDLVGDMASAQEAFNGADEQCNPQ